MKPVVALTVDGFEISSMFYERYISLTLTDESGGESDTLEVMIADTDPKLPLRKPPRGAEVGLSIGYENDMVDKGVFVVDEIEMGGWPAYMRIVAHAAPLQDSKSGKSALQSQKTRSWAKGTKLGDLAGKIAKEHKLEPAVAKSLHGIVLPQIDQTDESDLSLLNRLAKKYDAFVKPGGGKLALIKRGETKTASGEQMPTITLKPTDCKRWNMTESARDEDGTVIAYWQDKRAAKRQHVSAGSGDPVRRLRHNYPDKASAEKAAKAELEKRVRGKNRFTFEAVGNANAGAETVLQLEGFHHDVPAKWLMVRVEHRFDKSGGYSISCEAELPSDSESEASNEG